MLQGLRQRIRDSYEARWKAEKHFDEEEIMQELPNSLRTEACLLLLIVGLRQLASAVCSTAPSITSRYRPAWWQLVLSHTEWMTSI